MAIERAGRTLWLVSFQMQGDERTQHMVVTCGGDTLRLTLRPEWAALTGSPGIRAIICDQIWMEGTICFSIGVDGCWHGAVASGVSAGLLHDGSCPDFISLRAWGRGWTVSPALVSACHQRCRHGVF